MEPTLQIPPHNVHDIGFHIETRTPHGTFIRHSNAASMVTRAASVSETATNPHGFSANGSRGTVLPSSFGRFRERRDTDERDNGAIPEDGKDLILPAETPQTAS